MAFVISRTSPIGELVLNHPASASVLLEHGFHCIGCGLAAYETLEEGAAAHGFDDAAIDKLVQEIKDAAKHEEETLNQAADKSEAAAKKSDGAAGKSAGVAKAPAAKENKKAEKRGKKSKPG
jgi:hybrid cluster-associated redox disulfide protein